MLVEPDTLLVSGVATLMMLITDSSVVEVVERSETNTAKLFCDITYNAINNSQ